MEELSEEEIRVLANAFPDGGSARHLLLRAGLPAGQHPSWQARDAEGFWQAVSELFANGKLPGGRRRLLTAANQTLPGNGTFSAGAGAGVRGGPDWPSRPPVPSPRPASPPPNRAPSKDAPETARRRRRFAGLVAGALAIVILAVVGGVYGMIAIGQHYYQKVGDVAEPPEISVSTPRTAVTARSRSSRSRRPDLGRGSLLGSASGTRSRRPSLRRTRRTRRTRREH